MIEFRKTDDRGHANHGWSDAYHTFSFASYRDPQHMGFRSLRMMNEDFVEPGQGAPGGLGGLRGLVHVRSILSGIGVIVLPDQITVSRAFEAFDDTGSLTDEKKQSNVEGLGRSVAEMLVKRAVE